MTGVKEESLSDLKIAVFENRRREEMEAAIRRLGGRPLMAPAMEEIPLKPNPELRLLGDRLLRGEIHVLVLMTGVGTRLMLEGLTHEFPDVPAGELLKNVVTVCRGPKPVQALLKYGMTPVITVPEPNTWREILEAMDLSPRGVDLQDRTVAIQEGGISNPQFLKGLKRRGARILQVPVYRWALPEDRRPLEHAVRELAEGNVHVTLFTNGVQVRHLFQVAAGAGLENAVKRGINASVVASIGPHCTGILKEAGVNVDLEPSHPRIETLIEETARQAAEIIAAKKAGPRIARLEVRSLDPEGEKAKRQDSLFMRACRRLPVDTTPVWLMRQAGRYMKEYRDIRDRVGFLDLCKRPDLCAEITVFAQEAIGADAAIIFSDLLLILEAMGLGLQYGAGDGPQIEGRLHEARDVARLGEPSLEDRLSFVFEAIRLTRAGLKPGIPLLGFSGAPFTLASYMIEGGSSKAFLQTKKFMYCQPDAWRSLMEKTCRLLVRYLNLQIEAGADAVQIFDSWVGCLGPSDYEAYVLPYTRSVIEGIKPGVPVIHFGTGTGPFLDMIRRAGGDVIGIDYRVDFAEAWKVIGSGAAIQGNLDPAVLFADIALIRKRAKEILDAAGTRPGHIFNLGHGILPHTPVENVRALIDFVHEYSTGLRAGKAPA